LRLLPIAPGPGRTRTPLEEGLVEVGLESEIEVGCNIQQVAPDRLQVVTSPRHQGSFALRVEVRQGDQPIVSGNRAELVYWKNGAQDPGFVHGEERWYGFSTMWPTGFPLPSTWQVFTQFHHEGDQTGGLPLEMYLWGGTMYLRSMNQVLWTHPVELATWHDFVLHVYWANDTTGYIELWYDGVQVVPAFGQPRTYRANLYSDAGESAILKQGLYRDASIADTGVLYHDGMRVGTSYAAVAPP
jgi:hypothetical protein